MRLFILPLVVSLLFAGCSRDSTPADRLLGKTEQPSVLLILLDALRADACSIYGNERSTTPHLDALAAEGALFTRAYSQASYTVTSVSSMMTGLHPPRHGVHGLYNRLERDAVTLAELFQEGGYATAAITASPVVSGQYGLRQGFDQLTEIYKLPEVRARYNLKENELFYRIQARDFLDLAIRFLDDLSSKGKPDRKKPFFLYLHYMQPHTPYAPPEPFAGRFTDPDYEGTFDGEVGTVRSINGGKLHPEKKDLEHLRALYDENVAYVDDEVGRLLDELKRRGLYDDLLIVVLSDHGEAFGEHQYCGHNYTVHEEMVHIPWLWKFPAHATAAGIRSDALVELVDLLPTLAQMLELSEPGGADGVSLVPLLLGEADKVKNYAFYRTIHEKPEWGISDGHYKLIWSSENENSRLFHLDSDEGEDRDLLASDPSPEVTSRADALRDALLTELARESASGETAELDEETRSRLKALGYIND